jgi:hypothetical protein
MRKNKMVTQMFSFIAQLFDSHRLESLSSILPYLAKGSLYLLISRRLNWPAWFQKGRVKSFIPNCDKERRFVMKGFSFYFSQVMVLIAFLFILNGCYTTFQSARPYEGTDEDYYTSSSNPEGDEVYYQGEETPEYSESQLSFRPSRLVVEENYYGYNDYLRTVKYTVYDDDPWYDPYYYSGGYDRFSFYVQIGTGYPYYHHRPWYYPVYYHAPYYCWEPFIIWNDPWYWNPYPIYYPVVVYYPYPVYYPNHPYPPAEPDREFAKRDWDKRQPVDGRRIVSRTPSDSRQNTAAVTSNSSRIVRRPETGSQESGQNSALPSGRTVTRTSDNSGRNSRVVEKKVTGNNIRTQNNTSAEATEVKSRPVSRNNQGTMEKQIASSSVSRESEIFRTPVKKQPAINNIPAYEPVKIDNQSIKQNSGSSNRPETRTESRPKEPTPNYQPRPQSTVPPSSPKYTAPAKQESHSSYSSPAPSRNNTSEMRSQKSEPPKSDSNRSSNNGSQNSSDGRKSR